MDSNLPNNDDGNVLRGLQNKGVDLSKARKLEYYCYAANKAVASAIAEEIEKIGYQYDIYFDDESSSADKAYSVYCSRTMIPSYDGTTLAQEEINKVLINFNTYCDGWGTLVD